MKYLGRLASLFVLTLSLGLFAAQPAAALVNHAVTVPIPGTFLLLAGGLAGLVWWHAKHPRG